MAKPGETKAPEAPGGSECVLANGAHLTRRLAPDYGANQIISIIISGLNMNSKSFCIIEHFHVREDYVNSASLVVTKGSLLSTFISCEM